MESTMRIVSIIIGVFLSIPSLVTGQDQWLVQGCPNSSPTLDRIGINGCTKQDPDEFFIFHTNQNSFNLNSEFLEVRVEVQNGPFISNSWSSNSSAINALNSNAGCDRPLFIDPFSAPYHGNIPPYAKVWAFVQRNPQFTGEVRDLCHEEAIFVIFGNYSQTGVARSMFANTRSSQNDCERNIIVSFGSCRYDIVYSPEKFNDNKGDYIESSGSSVSYGTAPGCRPAFHSLPSSQAPIFNVAEVKLCEGEVNDQIISVQNGDSFTSWHFSPTEDPFHRGSNFTPDATDFPEENSDVPVSKSIWVYNYTGGRRSEGKEIRLTTLKNPFAEIVIPEIECSDDYFQPKLSGGSEQNGSWSISPQINIDSESGRIQLNDLNSTQEYQLQYLVEKEGCTYVAEEKLMMKDCSCSITATLENITCNDNGSPADPTDDTYTVDLLVQAENSTAQQWYLSDGTIHGNYDIPRTLGPFRIANGDRHLTIIDLEDPRCITEITISPPEPCSDQCEIISEVINITPCENDSYYVDISVIGNGSGNSWKSKNSDCLVNYQPIDKIGPFPIHEGNQTITIIDSEDPDCKTEITFTPPDPCEEPCYIEAEIINITPCENNSYYVDIRIDGNGKYWKSENRDWLGNYEQIQKIGPLPIHEANQTITIVDSEDPDCKTEVTFAPPDPCKEPCYIEVEIINITPCENDSYYVDISVIGNGSGNSWKSENRDWLGNYEQIEKIGPLPIHEANPTLTIVDSEDPDCKTEVTFAPPDPCKEPCYIEVEIISITPCENDFYYVDISVNGNGKYWKSEIGNWSGNYDQIESIGPFPIRSASQTITIVDSEDPDCKTEITFTPPDPCKKPCYIEAEIINITPCENDSYYVDIRIDGNGKYWKSEIGNWSGNYDQIEKIGPFPIHAASQTITIIDSEDPDCKTEITFTPPEPCTVVCDLNLRIIDSIIHSPQNSPQLLIKVKSHDQDLSNYYNIFLESQLIDILHHDETYILGPFDPNDVGKDLVFVFSKDSLCSLRYPIMDFDCQDKILIDAIPLPHPNNINQQNRLRLNLKSSLYPFGLYHQNQFIDTIYQSGIQEIDLLQPIMGDTIHFIAAAGEDCHSSFSIPNLNQKEIIYPNAFTPNHDDINDEFLLPPINCEGSITIHIYDKWGSILQSHQQKCADSMISIWDGRSREGNADPGLYIYMIHYTSGGKSYTRHGEIHLIR